MTTKTRREALQSIGLVSLVAVVGCGTDTVLSSARNDDGGGPPEPKDDARPAPPVEAGPPPPPPHPNVALLEQFVAAFNKKDLDLAMSFFSDTATMRLNGRMFDTQAKIRAFLTEYGGTTTGAALTSATMAFDKGLVFPDGVAMVGGRIMGAPQGQLSGFTPTSTIAIMAFGGVFQIDATNRFGACDVILDWSALSPLRS